MDSKIALNSNEIYQKKFAKSLKGYDPFEVDGFLDKVISDYQAFEAAQSEAANQMAKLQERIAVLEKSNEQLQLEKSQGTKEKKALELERATLKQRLDGIKPGETPTVENIQLLKRIRALEDFLYSKGFNPNEIVVGYKK